MPQIPRSARPTKKKTAKQLDREVAQALTQPRGNGNGNGNMERITRDRVHEALVGEHITRREPVEISLAGLPPEPWDMIFTTGMNYGGARAGRILIVLPKSGVSDPLAGLAYAVEYGRPYVHHLWIDSDARGRGLSRVLFDAYRSKVSPDLVVVGPFTKAGRAAALSAGATLEE